jgi:hypothetical protein
MLPPRLNEFMRWHFHKRHKVYSEIYALVNFACTGKKPPTPLAKCKIFIERHSNTTLDFDNAVASYKPIIDGLRHAGIIVDDTWEITGPWTLDQIYRKKKDGQMSRIIIEER